MFKNIAGINKNVNLEEKKISNIDLFVLLKCKTDTFVIAYVNDEKYTNTLFKQINNTLCVLRLKW